MRNAGGHGRRAIRPISGFPGAFGPLSSSRTGTLSRAFGGSYVQWSGRGSNPQPQHCERCALPIELPPLPSSDPLKLPSATPGCKPSRPGKRRRGGASSPRPPSAGTMLGRTGRLWGIVGRMARFLFATGIEGSNPVVADGRGGQLRQDEYESCGHYTRWREDLDLVKGLGVGHLRWGPPIHRTWTGAGRYDWSFCDDVLARMSELGIEPILDLCHFGMPDWLGNSFQNPDFPRSSPGMPATSPGAIRGSASIPRSMKFTSAPASAPNSAGGTSVCIAGGSARRLRGSGRRGASGTPGRGPKSPSSRP